ncbi:MAG: PQQ-dependent sugar dehydrogenase [Acidimicrobiales bacterium]
MPRLVLLLGALAAVAAACGDGGGGDRPAAAPAAGVLATFESAGTGFEVTSVATGLDTVWSLAWDPEGRLWFTERGGRLTRLGETPRMVRGVVESGEAGLMGLEIDRRGGVFVMYTGNRDNQVVEVAPDGSQRVLVRGIAKADIHDGGRLRFGPDGALYASTGDAGDTSLSQRPDSLNGKVLRIDTGSGRSSVFSLGHRNVQGLCVAPGGRFLATEHGPDEGDEINVISEGFNGGWPDRVGNGLRNYTPTIAPGGCAVYGADLIGAWKGSMLFVTLKDANLHRLTFGPDGSVAGDEVLLAGRFGRLRDVAVGPDGAVYLATSNRDGRGTPRPGDDRILRIAPA